MCMLGTRQIIEHCLFVCGIYYGNIQPVDEICFSSLSGISQSRSLNYMLSVRISQIFARTEERASE